MECVAANTGSPVGILAPAPPTHNGDNLDAWERGSLIVDTNLDGVPDAPVYFTLDPASPSLASIVGADSASILKTVGAAMPTIYATSAQLGLLKTDVIDALCLRDDGNAALNPGDVILFSLRSGSPTLSGSNGNYPGGAKPGDLIAPGGVVIPGGTLGLETAAGVMPDENDAAKCDALPASDADGDGVADLSDNCPTVGNGAQTNTDRALFLAGAMKAGKPLPWDLLGDACDSDDDSDDYTDADEGLITTDPLLHCGTNWPPNMNDGGSSANKVDIFDVNAMAPPVFFSVPPGPPYTVRKDLTAGHAITDPKIDIFDVNKLAPPVFFTTCSP